MNLDELERLERDATEGPWKHETNAPDGEPAAMWHEHYVYAPNARYETLPGNTSPVKVAWLPQSPTKRPAHDAAFIAALRNSARELIADARRYRWLKERLHGERSKDNTTAAPHTAATPADKAQDQPPAPRQP